MVWINFVQSFLEKIRAGVRVTFNETLAVIHEHYRYQPTAFSNGLAPERLDSPAGVNEGSCKIFAFAQLQGLDQQQTLSLFGDYYWEDVLKHPEASDHQNIRHFMQYGWQGIQFDGVVLTLQ